MTHESKKNYWNAGDIGNKIQREISRDPKAEEILDAPGTWDFFIEALAKRQPVNIRTRENLYAIAVTGVDYIDDETWVFRGFAALDKPGPGPLDGEVEAYMNLKGRVYGENKKRHRGCIRFVN